MRRVLQWTFLINGLMILLLILFLQIGRYQKQAPEFMLVTVNENRSERLYLYSQELDYWRPLTTPYSVIWQDGWHPSRKWFYVSGAMLNSNGDIVESDVWRVSSGGLSARYVPDMEFPLLATWTPDGTWLVYGLFDEHYYGDLYKVRPDGRDLQNLTADFEPSVMVSTEGHPILMSPDGQSVVFSAATNWFEAHRLALSGGHPEKLMTEIEEGGGGAQAWLHETNWLITYNGAYLYRVRPDGTQAQRLTTQLEVSERVEWVLEQQNLIVISQRLPSGDTRLMGLNISDWGLRWQLDGVSFLGDVTLDGQWLIVWFPERHLYRVRSSDGMTESLINLPENATWQGISPNKSWLLYSLSRPNDEGVELYRVGIEDGQIESLHIFPQLIAQRGWSPDSEWVLIEDYLEPETVQYWVHIDGNSVRPQHRLINRLIGWLPVINQMWSPSLMVAMGLGLLGVGFLQVIKQLRYPN